MNVLKCRTLASYIAEVGWVVSITKANFDPGFTHSLCTASAFIVYCCSLFCYNNNNNNYQKILLLLL